MEIFLLWIGLSVVAGALASNKGRSGFGFFLLSLFLSPIIGLLAAAAAKPDTGRQEREALNRGDMRKCPYCAEVVRSEASICRYCGKDLTNPKQKTVGGIVIEE